MRRRSGCSPRRAGKGRGLLVAILLALAPFGAGVASASSLLETLLGYDGYTVPGRWTPLWIRCAESPEAATVEVLRLAQDGRVIGGESFPLPAGVRIECPVSTGAELLALSVRLKSGDRVLAEARLSPGEKSFPGHLVLTCGVSARTRRAIEGALLPGEPVRAVAIEPGDLPSNGLDYDGVSAVVIGDGGLRLSPAQKAALTAWLAGGGWLALGPAPGGEDQPLASLGEGPSPGGAGGRGSAAPREYSSRGLGRGGIVRITRELSEPPASSSADFWRASLSLEPYGSSPRMSASEAEPGTEVAGRADEAASRAKLALVLALAAWLAATLGAAALGGGRRVQGSSKRRGGLGLGAAPLAAVALISLALVLAGRPSLDRSLMRGATAEALALVLPGSGASILSVRVARGSLGPAMSWMGLGALRPIPVDSMASDEKGSILGGRLGYQSWNHALPEARLSPKSTGSGELGLEAVLGPEALLGSSFPPRALLVVEGAGGRPPELESSVAMAFFAPGDTKTGVKASWWEKRPGSDWARITELPPWLGTEAPWLRGLEETWPDLAFLAGKGGAPSLGIGVAGGPLRTLCWACPVARAGSRAGGR